jgi:L-lactate dehydrogenase complex protein LldG
VSGIKRRNQVSRELILKAVAANQPELLPLPDISGFVGGYPDVEAKFIATLTAIGGFVHRVKDFESIRIIVAEKFEGRIIGRVEGLNLGEKDMPVLVHGLENVELAILDAQFAVAENGAVWLTETQMGERVVPFICQHLAIVVSAKNILPTMHEAYKKIGDAEYGFGAFIAGPSKTADIEQSLVLGAHGPRSMTIFITD